MPHLIGVVPYLLSSSHDEELDISLENMNFEAACLRNLTNIPMRY